MGRLSVPKTDYSKIAGYYDEVRSTPIEIWLLKIIEYGRIDPKCAVLDVGCGTGRFASALFRARNSTVYALDPSSEMLKQAAVKDRVRNVSWIRGEGEELPFRDDLFDCVYMTLVIHHIEDKEKALQEIHRVLKEGGNYVIMTNSHSRMKKSILHDFPGLTSIDLRRFPTVPSLAQSLMKIGFKDVHYHTVKRQEEDISTEEYLERVKNKYISTLTLLSEEAFQKGFKIFQRRVRRKYGARMRRILGFNFVVGRK